MLSVVLYEFNPSYFIHFLHNIRRRFLSAMSRGIRNSTALPRARRPDSGALAVAFSSEEAKHCVTEKTRSSFVLPAAEVWHPVAVLVGLAVPFLSLP